jgi:hypothetical protein
MKNQQFLVNMMRRERWYGHQLFRGVRETPVYIKIG